MHIKTFSYRFADEILAHPSFRDAANELFDICRKCPIPEYVGKSVRQPNKNVVQQIMNTYFKLQFEAHGWESEPLATPDDHADELRADFRKTFVNEDGKEITLQIEVEFGNVASSYRNYFKFQLSYSYGLTDICILIVPSYSLANRIDSGVSCFEKAAREIPQAKLSVTVPILVIGLFDKDEYGNPVPGWDIRAMGVPLDVAKNKDASVAEEHNALVQIYIDSITE